MLSIAARPPDEDHVYGYGKAEYFASGIEGTLILVAAIAIAVAAVDRLITPRPLEQVGTGLALSALASLVNFAVARKLLEAARHYRSIALEADARHLMTDVWTSAGIILGVAAVWLTGWERLDPLIALAVAVNIVWAGYQLMRRSFQGLLDHALPESELQALNRRARSLSHRGHRFPRGAHATGRRALFRDLARAGAGEVERGARARHGTSGRERHPSSSAWDFRAHPRRTPRPSRVVSGHGPRPLKVSGTLD